MRRKLLNTTWRVWLDGRDESEAETHRVVDGQLTVLLEAVARAGGVVDRRKQSVIVEPKAFVGEALRVLIDGELRLMRPGRIHDLNMKYTVRGPCGEATVDATWHLRLISANME